MSGTPPPETDGPNFTGIYGALTNPERQVYMMGAVWRLAQDHGRGPLKLLEVGSWSGLSTLTWAWAIHLHHGAGGAITCVDPWQPYLDATVNRDSRSRDINDALAADRIFDVFRRNVAFAPADVTVDIRRERSQDVLPVLAPDAFDLVSLDGDHSYLGVLADIRAAQRLVRDGGILCGDDLEVQAHMCTAALAELDPELDVAFDTAAGIGFHPGVTRAVGEVFGLVSAWSGFWAMRRRGDGWVPVSLDGMPETAPPHLPAEMLLALKVRLLGAGH